MKDRFDLISELKDKLAFLFVNDKRIIAVYLFGSSVQGIVHQKSDIDLAILLDREKSFSLDDILELEVKITTVLNTERFDLVIANNAPLILKFRIVSRGNLLYAANDVLRCDFEERVMQEYYDFLPRLNEFNHEYFAALKENYVR